MGGASKFHKMSKYIDMNVSMDIFEHSGLFFLMTKGSYSYTSDKTHQKLTIYFYLPT